MTRIAQIALFLPVAAGLHLAAFGMAGGADQRLETGAAGSGGQNLITLSATPAVAAMVADWSRPPEVTQALDAGTAPQVQPVAFLAPAEAAPVVQRPIFPTILPLISEEPRVTVETPRQAPALQDNAPQLAAVSPEAPQMPVAVPQALPTPGLAAPSQPQATTPEAPVTVHQAPRQPAADAPRPQARPKAAQPQPQTAAKQAIGKGNTAIGGQKSTAQTPGRQQALTASWAGQIQAKVARAHRVPRNLARAGLSGKVRVRIVVGRDGVLQSARIQQSSGNAQMDQAALDSVRRAGRFPKAPNELTRAKVSFDVPLVFRVN